MSGLIGAAQPQFVLRGADKRALGESYRQDVEVGPLGDYSSPWWPGSGFVGDREFDVATIDTMQKWFQAPDLTRGRNSRFGVVGVTRDVYGSPLAGVSLKLFRTANDSLVSIATSATDGSYVLSTPYYPDAHYLVSYKTGSPDVFGSSLNTLVGA